MRIDQRKWKQSEIPTFRDESGEKKSGEVDQCKEKSV
jgi:hypothetical protein